MTNEVTNEVIAIELIQESECLSDDFGKAFFDCEMAEKMLLKMAERKDQHLKEYLEKKKSQYSQAVTTFDVMRKKVIQGLINELFKEE